MSRHGKGLSRREFLVQGAASLGAVALAPALAKQAGGEGPTNRKVLHIIGHSHIDAAWLWPWRDGADTVLTTFRSALDRIKETPGFCYSHSSSVHYRWAEEADPEMVAEIKQRIDEGRWEVVGGVGRSSRTATSPRRRALCATRYMARSIANACWGRM